MGNYELSGQSVLHCSLMSETKLQEHIWLTQPGECGCLPVMMMNGRLSWDPCVVKGKTLNLLEL